jgi:tetratricopeptide (TPR) repeat protein
MKLAPVAVPVGFLLLTFVAPTNSQTNPSVAPSAAPSSAADHAPRNSFAPSNTPPPIQTPAQVSTAAATPGTRPLTGEEMGDLFMARKQYFEAAQTYKQLTDQEPKNAVYLNKLGIALHQQEALGLALKCYERALKADPHYADAANNIGTVWYQRKRFGKAIKAYEKAIKLRDDMPVLYSNLGYAYFGDKRYEESIAAFRIALSKDPQFFEHNSSRNGSLLQDRSVSDRGRFYFLLAKSFAESGNFDRAILYLRKAKDEGYATFIVDLKKDKAFTALLKNEEVQNLIAPKPAESEQP